MSLSSLHMPAGNDILESLFPFFPNIENVVTWTDPQLPLFIPLGSNPSLHSDINILYVSGFLDSNFSSMFRALLVCQT